MKPDGPALPPGFSWGAAAAMGAERAAGSGDEIPGDAEVEVDGTTFRRGGKVVLRPGQAGNPHDRLLHGHVATIERIYLDYEDRIYLAVVVDDDPGADLMRETGRFLFFFPHEVEAL